MPSPQRATKQRTAIRKVIQTHQRPLQPKEIQHYAQQDCGSLGIATVYRNLRTMEEAGEIEKLELPGIATCYCLPRMVKLPLLYCHRTGEIHWLGDQPVKLDLPRVPDNFTADHCEVIVFGEFRNDRR